MAASCVFTTASLARVPQRSGARASTADPLPPVKAAPARPHQEAIKPSTAVLGTGRRQALLGAGAAGVAGMDLARVLAFPPPAAAFKPPPPGLRLHKDRLDGYSFFYPEDWIPVTSAAQDIFYRDISDVETNCFVEFSSPSSSKYTSVADLGTPEDAAERALKQYQVEYMSTRIGVRRVGKVVSATARTADNGDLFYDIDINLKSYADSNQFGITPEERISQLEFDRRLVTTLGVKNKSLYELRLQTPESKVPELAERLRLIQNSFTLVEVDRTL